MEIVTRSQMKQIEQNALAYDLTFHRLMENAGSAAAAFIRRTFAVAGLNCMVFCGSGNNAGDGMVVARKLTEDGANMVIVLLDGTPGSEESAAMYNTAMMMQIPMVDFSTQHQKVMDFLSQTDIIVDAICGTGFTGGLREIHRGACRAVNEAIAAVVSLDIPTGVECDSGAADPDAVRADFTIAFDRAKPAHVLAASAQLCGVVETVDIGIPTEAHAGIPTWEQPAPAYESAAPESFVFQAEPEPLPAVEGGLTFVVPEEPAPAPPAPESPIPAAPAGAASPFSPESPFFEAEPAAPAPAAASGEIFDLGRVFGLLLPRPQNSHKGTFGRLLNISGSQNYTGAAALSSMAALRCGAGLVTLASTGEVCAAAGGHIPEATFLPLAKSAVGGIDFEGSMPILAPRLGAADAVLLGCGLGNTTHTAQLLAFVLQAATCPVVVDADGINALAQNIYVLQKASAPVVLTPHLGEMARLSGLSIQEISADRQGAALRFAQEHGVVLVLKGPGTLVASPDGRLAENTTGNPGLAKGGSGDVLAGMIGALLAQGIPPREAAACGVFLHGLAGDRCAARRSQYAMLPHELLEDLAEIFLENGR